jgi:hypothetical protein
VLALLSASKLVEVLAVASVSSGRVSGTARDIVSVKSCVCWHCRRCRPVGFPGRQDDTVGQQRLSDSHSVFVTVSGVDTTAKCEQASVKGMIQSGSKGTAKSQSKKREASLKGKGKSQSKPVLMARASLKGTGMRRGRPAELQVEAATEPRNQIQEN